MEYVCRGMDSIIAVEKLHYETKFDQARLLDDSGDESYFRNMIYYSCARRHRKVYTTRPKCGKMHWSKVRSNLC